MSRGPIKTHFLRSSEVGEDLALQKGILQTEMGFRIRRTREDLGLTQQEMADHVGLARHKWNMIEAGNRGISFVHLVRAARKLGVSLDYLILGELV